MIKDYKSLGISVILFIILVFIALFVHDNFVRPFLGDTLAVIWLYFTSKIFLKISSFLLSVFVLFVAYTIEFLQYLHILSYLKLEHVKILKIIFGSTFDINDILAYTLGWFIILFQIKYFSTDVINNK
ncbi:DUF2809 domain-containing protein [Arcobacter sp. CECT 8985]|uniref:ribosomal maturation YjgA family protein n=1 Tax=Arcobacter sp. CECT 8985 TaxID=1935424 RepID=UPI00100AD41F|nr:DUF2809 domain-containing protein [Arcobacter sp. CECT 8985]RXJ88075.1 hypothetical protein CRU93_00305 [Arcobacter sp. CECT 8985]